MHYGLIKSHLFKKDLLNVKITSLKIEQMFAILKISKKGGEQSWENGGPI